eukprot:602675-Alexandrium_andersonii.AAC.1
MGESKAGVGLVGMAEMSGAGASDIALSWRAEGRNLSGGAGQFYRGRKAVFGPARATKFATSAGAR